MTRETFLYKVIAMFLIGCICFGFTGFKVIQFNEVKNYVHSKTCQADHYLQLDCFDSCNGKQVNCQSHQKNNVPSEKTLINSFDSITEKPLEIICFASFNCEIQIVEILVYNNPFSIELFKPPLKS